MIMVMLKPKQYQKEKGTNNSTSSHNTSEKLLFFSDFRKQKVIQPTFRGISALSGRRFGRWMESKTFCSAEAELALG